MALEPDSWTPTGARSTCRDFQRKIII